MEITIGSDGEFFAPATPIAGTLRNHIAARNSGIPDPLVRKNLGLFAHLTEESTRSRS
jgi:hypothetical protein